MSQSGSVIFRVFAAVILVAVLFGGGYMAFHAGQTQGYALGVAAGENPSGTAVDRSPVPAPYYPMMGHHFFPFMGFFWFIPVMFVLCMVFGLFRAVIWGPRWARHGGWMHGPHCKHPWHGDYPWGEPGHDETPGSPEADKK